MLLPGNKALPAKISLPTHRILAFSGLPKRMIHPHTALRLIDERVGYGVFATELIPAGTITYIKDSLELVISPTDYLLHGPDMQAVIEKYSYIDECGNRRITNRYTPSGISKMPITKCAVLSRRRRQVGAEAVKQQ